jgi:transcriptional regulator with XRE-family HTH domain
MVIGDRLRELRENRNFSQGDIEKRTGLLRCYISRVENGHTIPAVETLEKLARALEVPLYQIFYSNEESTSPKPLKAESALWGSRGKDARLLALFRRSLNNIRESDRQLLLHMARKMAKDRTA